MGSQTFTLRQAPRVGIFFHPEFKGKSQVTYRDRLRDFPEALAELLQKPNVRLNDCPRVSRDLLLKVHPPEMITMVDLEEECTAAYTSVGGVVAAMEALSRRELDRAFCFTGTGGHHAGLQEFWDESCFNDVAVALTRVRETGTCRRLAVVDTDARHAGGTMQLLGDDPEVLYFCFCRSNYRSLEGSWTEVNVFSREGQVDADTHYLEKVRLQLPKISQFQPDLLVWYFGFNTHADEYASLGLTAQAYPAICELLASVAAARDIPLLVVLGGGSLHTVAGATIPAIIRRLAQDQ